MTTPSRIRLDPAKTAQNRRRLHLREIVDAGPEKPHTVGSELRAARVRAGYDLREVGDALRIRYRHLEALECGYFNELPGKAYAVGFVRAYAEHLGLNPNDLVRRFKTEVGEDPVAAPLPEPVHNLGFPETTERPKLPTGISMIVVSTLVIAGVAGWYLSRSPVQTAEADVPEPPQFVESDQPLLRPHPSVPVGGVTQIAAPVDVSETRAAQLAAALDAAGEDDADTAEAETPAETGEESAGSETAIAEAADEDPSNDDNDAIVVAAADETSLPEEEGDGLGPVDGDAPSEEDEAAEIAALVQAVEQLGPPVQRSAAARAPDAAIERAPASVSSALEAPALRTTSADDIERGDPLNAPGTASASRIQVLALKSAWLRVDDGEGDVLVQRRLREGEIFAVPANQGLVMAARNAGAFQILVDGRPIGRAGQDGEVLSGLSLDVWDLKERELASGQ